MNGAGSFNIPQPLIEDISKGACLPFVGAGFSLNAEMQKSKLMPTWRQLGQELSRAAGIDTDSSPPDAASQYERQFGRVQLLEAIREALHVEDSRPGPAHIEFATLPFDTVFTTNFDTLLEQAYVSKSRPLRTLSGDLQMSSHGGRLTTNIVKMHGDVGHLEHMVVTRADYDGYIERYPVVSTLLSSMLITRTPLFIGYGRADSNFIHIEEVVNSRLGEFKRMPYLIQFCALEGEIQSALDSHLHIISLEVPKESTRGEVLADFLFEMQSEVDTITRLSFQETRPDLYSEATITNSGRVHRTPSERASVTPMLCSISMPTSVEFDRVYHFLVKPAVIESGLEPTRGIEANVSGSIIEQTRVSIQQARLAVADISRWDSSVMYELSIAESFGVPIILLAAEPLDQSSEIPNPQLLTYDPIKPERSQSRLKDLIDQTLVQSPWVLAERLIAEGNSRAAIAMLTIELELALRRQVEASIQGESGDAFKRPSPLRTLLIEAKALYNLNDTQLHQLEAVNKLRSKAIHELSEPTSDEARFVMSSVQEFLREIKERSDETR